MEEKNEKEFEVIVDEDGTRTKHVVTLDDEYYKHLTKGNVTKKKLIKRSFEFLLKREPKESILSRFDLRIINTYFPEYEEKIKII